MDIQDWIADWLAGSYPDPVCDFNIEAVKFLRDMKDAGFELCPAVPAPEPPE